MPADAFLSDPEWQEHFVQAQGQELMVFGVDEQGLPVIARKRIRYGNEMRELKDGLPLTYCIGVAEYTRYVQPKRCHDCGVLKDEYHLIGCDDEECPLCHHQLISCICWADDEEDD